VNIRDYTTIARGIASSTVPPTTPHFAPRLKERQILVKHLADTLAAQDAQFDREWFMRACGVAG
jgi:hypothetical protein